MGMFIRPLVLVTLVMMTACGGAPPVDPNATEDNEQLSTEEPALNRCTLHLCSGLSNPFGTCVGPYLGQTCYGHCVAGGHGGDCGPDGCYEGSCTPVKHL